MSEALLRARSGMEQSPISYSNISFHNVREIPRGISLTFERTFWFAYMIYGEYSDRVEIYYRPLMDTRYSSKDTLYTDSSLDNKGIEGFLIDDDYYYFTSVGVAQIIRVDRKDTYSFDKYVYDEYNAFSGSGQMKWFDNHTICCAYGNGFVFFDTITGEFTYKQASTSFDIGSFCVGAGLVVGARTTQNNQQLLVYNKTTDAFSTISLSSDGIGVVSYNDGKFYVVQTGYLTIIDASTLAVSTEGSKPWTNPRSILASGNCVFVSCYNSSVVYINDRHAGKIIRYGIPIKTQTTQSTDVFTDTSYDKMFLLMDSTGYLMFDFQGYTRFNFGLLYQQDVVTAYEQSGTIDNPFIVHPSGATFITMTNGTLSKELTEEGTVQNVKKVSMHRGTDYNVIKSMEMINNRFDPNVITTILVSSGEKSTFYTFADLKTYLQNQYWGDVDVYVGANVSTSELRGGFFYSITSLHSMTFYASFETLYTSMFYSCSAMVELNLPEGVKTIESTFINGTSIESIILPDSVRTLKSGAFASNSEILHIVVGSGIETIESAAFSNCYYLRTVEIGSSIQSIATYAFNSNCYSLESITVHAVEDSVAGAPWGAPSETPVIWDP